MNYFHTQKAPLGKILLGVAGLQIALGIWFHDQPPVMSILLLVGATVLVAALAFNHLTIFDEGEHLALRFGPLPLFRKRIPYKEITGVQPDRSSLLDGWGIHYNPWRGWIYNLWGFDCVKILLGESAIRIGSDDVANLVNYLRSRMEPARTSQLNNF